MKKTLCFVLCLVLMLGAVLPVSAMVTVTNVQLVHIRKGTSFDVQTTVYYATVEEALKAAADGDIIEIFDNVTVSSQLTVPADIELTFVSGTKRETTAIFGRSAFEYTDQNAPARTVTKNFSGSLFRLGENSSVTFENVILDGGSKGGVKGGLIYAENGASLTVKRGVTLKNSKLTGDTFGGAIYAEKNSSVTVENTVFSGNTASVGKDIYAEQKSDVSLASGISADFAYPVDNTVDISGLNLILDGEIGIVFHTKVTGDYVGGTFVLSSRTGDDVTYNIADCATDGEGRYLAKYNVSAVELAEPITLTVYDKNGTPVATKEKSVEDYGKVLLADAKTTEKEKNVITKLLNYGHFSQLSVSSNQGWVIGEDFAEIPQYCDLTVDPAIFKDFKYKFDGHDSAFNDIGVSLSVEYKTGINLYFTLTDKPTVTVNGEETDVEAVEKGNYHYRISIRGISALDLDKEFTVVVNGKYTFTVSALSYCDLAVSHGNAETKDSVKALYEFFVSTVEYNAN